MELYVWKTVIRLCQEFFWAETQQNREQTQSPTMWSTTNQQYQNHHLRRDSSLSHLGAKMHFTRTIILDSIVVKTQKMLSSHGGFLTTAMYHHSQTM